MPNIYFDPVPVHLTKRNPAPDPSPLLPYTSYTRHTKQTKRYTQKITNHKSSSQVSGQLIYHPPDQTDYLRCQSTTARSTHLTKPLQSDCLAIELDNSYKGWTEEEAEE